MGYWDSMNLYTYVNNNPVNWIDPFGLCKGDKEKEWWEKLEEGYYYGTGYGEEALDWWTQRYEETGEWYYGLGGMFSALWTPETYQSTGWTLITAASTVVKVGSAGAEPTHVGLDLPGKRNIIHYGRHVKYGKHIGIGFKKPYITKWHWWPFK